MGGVIDTLFGGGKEQAYGDLQNYIKQGMGQRTDYENRAEKALAPYMGDPRLQTQYENAIASGADPQALYNKFLGGYQESPFAKIQQQRGMQAIQQAGAASGMHGSGQELMDLQKNAQDISAADMNDYLSRILGIRSDYLGRLGNLAGTESAQQYGAHGDIARMLSGLGGEMAGDYQNLGTAKAYQDMGRAGGLNKLLGGALGAISAVLPGGSAIGKIFHSAQDEGIF